ncbi:hypothetical protein AMTRI_Chr12g234110 [Amborella trichopoda]|uniref:AP2/ERF domain-containing protein n=1 Tax=Amborella trichopoda TaxID=13333 RepID=W1PD79_AMBTC|nr:ethylene-responsive transcription factor ERF017 [Amborella trichopoda]ERN05581.1 hypothetical protein AMTR_s00007p00268460 [Amborella trichopoda]|eukprot:XP_006843906.1 ethylene-responsive transcription factor ERF017 [Amborella trichopoda]
MVRPSSSSGTRTRPGRRENSSSDSGGSGQIFKGVRMRKWGKWVAEVRLPNSRERIWLGSYDAPEKAARAYDAAVFCLRGPSAKLNFPANPPEISAAGSLSPAQIQLVAARFAHEGPPPTSGATSDSPGMSGPERQEPSEGNTSEHSEPLPPPPPPIDWPLMDEFLPESNGGGVFHPSLEGFTVGNFIPTEEEEEAPEAGDAGYYEAPTGLWTF